MRNTKKFGTSIKKEIFEKLERASKQMKYKKSTIIEIALEYLFQTWRIK